MFCAERNARVLVVRFVYEQQNTIFKNAVYLLENCCVKVYNVDMDRSMSAITYDDAQSLEYLIKTRRYLHSIAELSGAEFKTSQFIVNELKSFGYKPKLIKTGVFCDKGKGKSRIAFRADIDALPIKEDVSATKIDFAATGEVMHACGHDGHTANLLNVARILAECDCANPLRFIFQFDEEDCGGSLDMIDGGVLDGVSEIYALHLCPEIDMGNIGYCYGSMFAGCIEFDVLTRGISSHCANKECGADAIAAAIDAVQSIEQSAIRNNALFNLGKITGGNARNIVADSCKAECTLRFFDGGRGEAVIMDAERALTECDEKYSTTHDIKSLAVYPPLINTALAVDKVRAIMGDIAISVAPRYTAEDFSNYLTHVPGCMVWLGTKTQEHNAPLHSNKFSFDESALTIGTEMFVRIAQGEYE